MTLLERLKRHVMFLDDSDDSCWIWTGATRSNGRGKLRVGKKHVSAHRIAWEFFNGRSLKPGMRLRQECTHPQCVRHWQVDRPWKKLSDDQVRQIMVSALPTHALAIRYGVGVIYIRQLRCGVARSKARWSLRTGDNVSGRACA